MNRNEDGTLVEVEPQQEETPEVEQPKEETEPTEEEVAPEPEGEPKEGVEAADPAVDAEDEPEEAETPEAIAERAKYRRPGKWERHAKRLERQNDELISRLTQGQPPPAQPQQPEKPKGPEAQVDEYLVSKFEEWTRQRQDQERRAKIQAEFEQRVEDVKATLPDWDDAIQSVRHVPVSTDLQRVLSTSKHGPVIMYQLAKNPAELRRLSALPGFDAALEIGRLEERLSSRTAAPKTTKPAARPPAPPTSAGGSPSSTRSLDDLPISEYKRAFRSGRR